MIIWCVFIVCYLYCILVNDYTYLRFLRARSFNISAASDMLTKSLKWRKDNDVDTILTNPPPELAKLIKLYRQGLPARFLDTFDVEGRPIYVLVVSRYIYFLSLYVCVCVCVSNSAFFLSGLLVEV